MFVAHCRCGVQIATVPTLAQAYSLGLNYKCSRGFTVRHAEYNGPLPYDVHVDELNPEARARLRWLQNIWYQCPVTGQLTLFRGWLAGVFNPTMELNRQAIPIPLTLPRRQFLTYGRKLRPSMLAAHYGDT